MKLQTKGAAKRLILSLLLVVSASGCAYDPYYYAPSQPYYSGSQPYYGYSRPYYGYGRPYYGYSAPYYVGPPISLGLGFSWSEHRGHSHHGGHGWGHGYRGHGWGHGYRGHGGRGGRGGHYRGRH